MKLVYNQDNFKAYTVTILNYSCFVSGTTRRGYLVKVPYGKTRKDKKMFDDLVYYHKSEYYGKTPKKAILKVRKFIKNYKIRKAVKI